MSKDGKLYIIDRMKRMIIRHDGFKIFPNLVEDVILLHPLVENCKVVGIDDSTYSQGKLPKAHIVLKKVENIDEDIVIEEIKKICLDKLPEYSQPVDYKIRNSLPLTSIGKIDYIKLEEEDKQNLLVKKLAKK
jgi:long-chain acyl-CoA synthetase